MTATAQLKAIREKFYFLFQTVSPRTRLIFIEKRGEFIEKHLPAVFCAIEMNKMRGAGRITACTFGE
jgi:hypothetical protein